MRLEEIYKTVIDEGIKADIRTEKRIHELLSQTKNAYKTLSVKERDFFDKESLSNPFPDSRILCGDPKSNISSAFVGIDVTGEELLLIDRLKEKGRNIDLVISHHPQGRAYANFYEVMDLQIDAFDKEGISISTAETLLKARKSAVERKIHAVNHERFVDMAKLLKINFLCMHTPADNLAYQFMKKTMDKKNPKTLKDMMSILLSFPEYREAAKNNNPPKIILGAGSSRCHKIHIEFTGGTEGPVEIYEKLSGSGIDTIISMHQSEEHFKKCREANINVIFASHIASDTLGMNLMLDRIEKKGKLKIDAFSGFRRFKRH